MTADEVLALAEDLRWFARQMGRDLNAANLFVHAMLMRAVLGGPSTAFAGEEEEGDVDLDEPEAA